MYQESYLSGFLITRPLLEVTTAGTGELVAIIGTEVLAGDLDTRSLSATGWTTVGLSETSALARTGKVYFGSSATVTGWSC